MTIEQNKQDTAEHRLKKEQEENELLLVQIHQLEEELEHYFKRNQDLEKGQAAKSGSGLPGISWVDDELPDALAEIQRLHALVEVLRKTHQLETENALNVKLGNILIQGVDSPGNLVAVPGKVGKIWRESNRKKPPKALGGKGFEKVIKGYSDGEFKAVEKLFARLSLAPAMQANGYTALARHVMKSDRAATAEAARRAYEIDPQPFRLKWLAFRLHEAGDVIEAEAMMDILPKDTTFSESELRHANKLRNEAKHVRQHEAKQKTRFSERRAEVERRVSEIQAKIEQEKGENELLLLQLHQAQEELEGQYLRCQTLEQEKEILSGKKDEQAKLFYDQHEQIEQLKQIEVEIAKRENELLRQLHQMEEELESQCLRGQTLEQEKQILSGQHDELVKFTSEREMRIEQLTQKKATVESEFGHEIEALKDALAKLVEEKQVLSDQKDKQVKLAAELETQVEKLTGEKTTVESEFGREIKALKEVLAKLAEEKQALLEQRDEQTKLASELQTHIEQLTEDKISAVSDFDREIEALKEALTKVGQEKVAVTNQKNEQEKLSEQLNVQLREAQQDASLSLKIQMLREADLNDLQARYQASRAQEENQHQLLTKLGKRLNTASAYFNEIVNKGTQEFIQEEGNFQTAKVLKQNTDGTEGKP